MDEQQLEALASFCAAIPPARAAELVSALRAHPTWLPAAEYGRICGLGSGAGSDLAALMQQYGEPALLACAIETGVFMQQKAAASRLAFVWSGPSRLFSNARKTGQVLLDLISEANEQILLASFAVYKIAGVQAELAAALQRGVRVRIILENSSDSRGQLAHDGRQAFGKLAAAEFYHWPLCRRHCNAVGLPAKMHAKCALNENCFLIGSANLTDDAISRNIELGVLRHDRADAAKLLAQFELLIRNGILTRTE